MSDATQPRTIAAHLEAAERFERAWSKEQAKEKDAHARASVQVALRCIEERPRLMRERDQAVKHATIGVAYVARLREKLVRQERLIRELRDENRALLHFRAQT